jgi:hypothetical protein
MEHLELDNTSWSSVVPSELGQLSALRVLDLRCSTNLSGKLPKEFNNIKSLVTMNLCRTNVTYSGVMDRGIGEYGIWRFQQPQ